MTQLDTEYEELLDEEMWLEMCAEHGAEEALPRYIQWMGALALE